MTMKNWKQYVDRGLICGGIMVLAFLLANLWYLWHPRTSGQSMLPKSTSGFYTDTGGIPVSEINPLENEYQETESVNDVKPKIALTFDDGPHPIYTPKLLDGLKKRGVKATFFVLGENIVGREDIIKRMADEGHLIGNHTYTHVNLNQLSAEKACGELVKTNDLVRKITGKGTDYVRPPFGVWNKKLECSVNMLPIMWNIDPLDWANTNTSEVVNKVVTKAKENAIILLHDYYDSSVDAALLIVDELQKKGYQFVTAEEIILE